MPADIAILTASTLNALAPYAKMLAEGVSEGIGGQIVNWIKDKFTDKRKKEAFETYLLNVTDPTLKGKIQAWIEDIIVDNDELINQLTELVKAAEKEQAQNGTINKVNVTGHYNIVSTDNKNSTITITQNIPPKKDEAN